MRTNRTSTYDLAAFDPSLGYMLALGGLDRFLGQLGITAGDDETDAAHVRVVGVHEAREAISSPSAARRIKPAEVSVGLPAMARLSG